MIVLVKAVRCSAGIESDPVRVALRSGTRPPRLGLPAVAWPPGMAPRFGVVGGLGCTLALRDELFPNHEEAPAPVLLLPVADLLVLQDSFFETFTTLPRLLRPVAPTPAAPASSVALNEPDDPGNGLMALKSRTEPWPGRYPEGVARPASGASRDTPPAGIGVGVRELVDFRVCEVDEDTGNDVIDLRPVAPAIGDPILGAASSDPESVEWDHDCRFPTTWPGVRDWLPLPVKVDRDMEWGGNDQSGLNVHSAPLAPAMFRWERFPVCVGVVYALPRFSVADARSQSKFGTFAPRSERREILEDS